jgi:hypothetical protein
VQISEGGEESTSMNLEMIMGWWGLAVVCVDPEACSCSCEGQRCVSGVSTLLQGMYYGPLQLVIYVADVVFVFVVACLELLLESVVFLFSKLTKPTLWLQRMALPEFSGSAEVRQFKASIQ